MIRMVIRAYTVIKGDSVDDHELAKVVLVRRVVAVPCDDVEWRVAL